MKSLKLTKLPMCEYSVPKFWIKNKNDFGKKY